MLNDFTLIHIAIHSMLQQARLCGHIQNNLQRFLTAWEGKQHIFTLSQAMKQFNLKLYNAQSFNSEQTEASWKLV